MGLLDDYNPFLSGKPKVPGFPPMWSPEREERGRANIRPVLEGKDIAGGGDPPELKGLNLFPEPKLQDRLTPTFDPSRFADVPPPFDPSRFADVPAAPP